MRLKHSFCNSENRIGSELLQVSEVFHKSWSLTIRLVIKRLHYIDQNLFSAINLDLPRKVRYKPRQKRRGDREVPGYRKGRTYADFELYMAQNPDSPVVEMDIVKGAGGKGLCWYSCSLLTAGNISKKSLIPFMTDWEPHPMGSCSL